MEVKRFKRFLALLLMVVTIVASSMAVMAADTKSPSGGDTTPDPVIVSRSTAVNGNSGKTVVCKIDIGNPESIWSHLLFR